MVVAAGVVVGEGVGRFVVGGGGGVMVGEGVDRFTAEGGGGRYRDRGGIDLCDVRVVV